MTPARKINRLALALALALASAPDVGHAAEAESPDWPCIQRKVPEISPAMVWDGPPVEELDADWRVDPVVGLLANRIALRRMRIEDAERAIADFAASLGVDKDQKLTMLFAGALALINGARAHIISGIERYTRRQRALANRIQEETATLGTLDGDDDEATRAQRDEFEQMLVWDTRIFEEREHSLTYICQQPVRLEQRIFALGREIMRHLD